MRAGARAIMYTAGMVIGLGGLLLILTLFIPSAREYWQAIASSIGIVALGMALHSKMVSVEQRKAEQIAAQGEIMVEVEQYEWRWLFVFLTKTGTTKAYIKEIVLVTEQGNLSIAKPWFSFSDGDTWPKLLEPEQRYQATFYANVLAKVLKPPDCSFHVKVVTTLGREYGSKAPVKLMPMQG